MEEFLLCNFIEITLLHGWSPVNLLRFSRIPFLKNTYGVLLLDIYHITRNTFILSIFSFQFINIKKYLWKQQSVFKLVSLITSHTKVSKLYFYKCEHFLLFLSLSTVIIPQFHSYTKILTRVLLIPTHSSLHSHPDSPHSHHSHPDSSHAHPDSPHSHHFPHSVPQFPISGFTDSLWCIMPKSQCVLKMFLKFWQI